MAAPTFEHVHLQIQAMIWLFESCMLTSVHVSSQTHWHTKERMRAIDQHIHADGNLCQLLRLVPPCEGDVIASSSSMGSEQSAFSLSSAMAMGTPHGAPGRHMSESSESPLSTARSWPKRFTKLLRACSSSSVGENIQPTHTCWVLPALVLGKNLIKQHQPGL